MDDIAKTIQREEEKKRFLIDLQDASPRRMAVMFAERMFKIEDFQETQNHNSTQALEKVKEIEQSQKGEVRVLWIVVMLSLIGQIPSAPAWWAIIRSVLGW